MTNSIWTNGNGSGPFPYGTCWDLSVCNKVQFIFFDGLLNRDSENIDTINEVRLGREGAAVVNDYINPPKIACFGHYA